MPTWYVYGLRDPNTQEFRYVGQSELPERRLTTHLLEAARPSSGGEKVAWLRRLLEAGQRPELVILAPFSPWTEPEAEARWIADLHARGHNLTNVRCVPPLEVRNGLASRSEFMTAAPEALEWLRSLAPRERGRVIERAREASAL